MTCARGFLSLGNHERLQQRGSAAALCGSIPGTQFGDA